MKEIIILIFLCATLILFLILYDKNKYIKELESLLEYYRWHDAIYDLPINETWYLTQTNENNPKIKVLFYCTKQKQWYEDNLYQIRNEGVVAWCHLPNYLYHK